MYAVAQDIQVTFGIANGSACEEIHAIKIE